MNECKDAVSLREEGGEEEKATHEIQPAKKSKSNPKVLRRTSSTKTRKSSNKSNKVNGNSVVRYGTDVQNTIACTTKSLPIKDSSLNSSSEIQNSIASTSKTFLSKRKYSKSKYNGKYYGNILNEDFNINEAKHSKSGHSQSSSVSLSSMKILESYNFNFEVLSDSQKMQNSFYLQDKYMNAFFKYYPEFICLDVLCEIPDLDLSVYVLSTLDSNCLCEIVAVGLIKSNDYELSWFCESFKKHNPHWKDIKLIFCDIKEINMEVIKNVFPEKTILISSFHSIKALKIDLSKLDDKPSEQDTKKAIQIFENMINSSDDSVYAELLKEFKQVIPSIIPLFKKKWYSKRDSWALGMHLNSNVFLKSINSYLLVIRKTLRPLINTHNSFEVVIKNLSSNQEKIRKEKFEKFTSVFNSILLTNKTSNVMNSKSCIVKYSKFLTSYGTELILEQISNSYYVRNLKKLSPGRYTCSSEDIISINSCSCNFFQLLLLPCSHILAVRKLLSLPLYMESLCANHWIAKNYQNTFLELRDVYIPIEKSSTENSNENMMFKKYFKLSDELWPLLTNCPESITIQRIKILKSLVKAWKSGFVIELKSSDANNTICGNDIALEDLPADYWREMYGITLNDIIDSDNDFSAIAFGSNGIIPEFSTPMETINV